MQLISGFSVGEQMGGAELFGIQLARQLDTSRFEPIVCGVWYEETASERAWIKTLQAEGIQHVCLARPTGALVHDFRSAARRLWSIVDLLRPAVINSHSEHSDSLNALMRMAHPAAGRSVRTMHTDQQWQDRPWVGKLLLELVFPLVFDAEVAISKTTQAVLDRRALAQVLGRRAVLAYNGIDAAFSPRAGYPAPQLEPGLQSTAPVRHIAVIGRLEQQKGHTYLLDALKHLGANAPLRVHVIGSGSLRPQLEQQAASLGVQHLVDFMGSRDDVPELLPQIDLVVSASLWEGFPTVLLEAMKLGVPVVATDVSGSRELVLPGQTGLLVPPSDAARLADAMRQMLDHPAAAAAMGRAAQAHAARFTIQAAALEYTRLYARLTGA